MEHCVQNIGFSVTHTFGGFDTKKCWLCNKVIQVGWNIEARQIEDHGLFGTYNLKVYNEIKKETCSAREALDAN